MSIVGILETLEDLDDLDGIGSEPSSTSAPDGGKSDSDVPLLRGLTYEERCEHVWMNRLQGLPVKAMAAHYGVSSSTIYRWLNDGVQLYRQKLENRPAADIIAESLMFLRQVRDTYLLEARTAGAGEITVDPDTGEIVRSSKVASQNKGKMLEGALKAEKLANDFMLETGIIPREAEKIYHTLRGDDTESAAAKHPDERSDEEVMKDVMELLKHGRRI